MDKLMNLLGYIQHLTATENKDKKFIRQMDKLFKPYLHLLNSNIYTDMLRLNYENTRKDWGTERHFVSIAYSPGSFCNLDTGYVDINFGHSKRIYDDPPDYKKVEEAFKFRISQFVDNHDGNIRRNVETIIALEKVTI